MKWAYFDAGGMCEMISTVRESGQGFVHEREVPDEFKPNTTRLNLSTDQVETFLRPPLPPPTDDKPDWLARVIALEERVTKLENS
jgi:hypothetical protein